MQTKLAAVVLLNLVVFVHSAFASDPLPQVKEFYNAAEYDRVLALVRDVEAADSAALTVELHEYRGLSLLALARTDEAEQVIARLFQADPFYTPAATASPRWKTMVERVRARVRPEIIRTRYESAKQHFDARDFEHAAAEFDVLKKLLAASKADGASGLDDLSTLTEGFLQLSRTALAPPAPAAAVTKATPPPAAVSQTLTQTPVIKPPVALKRGFPRWDPPSFVNTRQVYTGRIGVTVGEDGSVTSVRILDSVHPSYDSVLLGAAKRWRFEPATRDGQPIPYEVEVPVSLSAASAAER